MPENATEWGDLALGASGSATVVAALVLGALVVAHTLRTRPPGRVWLAHAAVLLVLVGTVTVPTVWFVAFPLLVATFPDGRFVPRWLLPVVAGCAVLTVGDLVTRGAWSEQPWWSVVGPAQTLLLGAQVHRYRRRSTTEERAAVRWVILGTLLTTAAFLTVLAAYGTIGTGPTGAVVGADLALLPLQLCLAGAVVRPELLDVDRLLHGTLVAVVAVPILASGYVALTGVAGPWPGVLLVGVATVPVVRAARWVADRVVYRARPTPERAVAVLLQRLTAGQGDHPTGESVPGVVVSTVTDLLALDDAGLRGGWFDPIGPAAGDAFAVDYRGEPLATLHVPPRRGETALTRRDREVVSALVAHAAPALHGARVLADLQESRQRVVATREEERRRLRRDLHDDLGPALSGISLSAAALARTTGLAQAAELHEDVKQAMVRSRGIAYDLRPPVLDDHGLVAAVVDRTRADDDLRVEVLDAPLPPLPAAVDLAALRIVTEAVANVRKHAAATCVEVAVGVEDAHLCLVVADDGVGLPVDVRPGIGMHSIAERAEEVGGTARYDRSAPGTRLVVRLPLEVTT